MHVQSITTVWRHTSVYQRRVGPRWHLIVSHRRIFSTGQRVWNMPACLWFQEAWSRRKFHGWRFAQKRHPEVHWTWVMCVDNTIVENGVRCNNKTLNSRMNETNTKTTRHKTRIEHAYFGHNVLINLFRDQVLSPICQHSTQCLEWVP